MANSSTAPRRPGEPLYKPGRCGGREASVRRQPPHNHKSAFGLGSRREGKKESLLRDESKPKAVPEGRKADRTEASSDNDRVAQQLRSSPPCSLLLAGVLALTLLPQASQRVRTTGVKLPSQTKQGPGSRAQLVLACDKGGPILAVLIGHPHEHGVDRNSSTHVKWASAAPSLQSLRTWYPVSSQSTCGRVCPCLIQLRILVPGDAHHCPIATLTTLSFRHRFGQMQVHRNRHLRLFARQHKKKPKHARQGGRAHTYPIHSGPCRWLLPNPSIEAAHAMMAADVSQVQSACIVQGRVLQRTCRPVDGFSSQSYYVAHCTCRL